MGKKKPGKPAEGGGDGGGKEKNPQQQQQQQQQRQQQQRQNAPRDSGSGAGPSQQQRPQQKGGRTDEGFSRQQQQHGKRDGDWECPRCQQNNYANRTDCYKCHVPKDSGSGFGAGPSQQQRPQQKFVRSEQQSQQRTQQPKEKRDGDWECPKCRVNNYARNMDCYRCGAPKEQAPMRPQQRQQPPGQMFPTLPTAEPSSSAQGVWGQPQQQFFQGGPPQVAPFSSVQQTQVPKQKQQDQPQEGKQKEKDWKKKKQKDESSPAPGSSRDITPAPSMQPTQTVQQPPQEGKPKEKFDWKKEKKQKGEPSSAPGSSREITPAPSTSLSPTSSVHEIEQQMKDLQSSPSKSKLSPYPVLTGTDISRWQGTKGAKFPVKVNFLQIVLNNLPPTAYHYDVTFDPDRPKKMYQSILDKFFGQHPFAFDGKKNVYTANKLPSDEIEKEVKVNDPRSHNEKTFKVKVKIANEVDMRVLQVYNRPGFHNLDKPSTALQVLDVVLRSIFKKDEGATTAGRAIYYQPNSPMDLGEGMELWLGLFQSAILGRKQIYLNVDVAHKAFPKAMSLLDVLPQFQDRKGYMDWNKFEHYLKQLDIEYKHDGLKKTYGFNGLKDAANKQTFTMENGKKMTIEQYFLNEKKYKLRRPDLPCLHVGSKIRNVYLPLELCYIPGGQANNKKCPSECVAKMIRYSATSTDERKQKIENLLQRINYSDSNVINKFGIQVNKGAFEQVEARKIAPPDIQYQNKVVRVDRGVWRGENFLQPDQKLTKWAILNCDDRVSDGDLNKLRGLILQQSATHRIQLDPQPVVRHINMMRVRPNELEGLLDKLKKDGYSFVVVVIIDRNDCYAKVKQAAEITVGILTQCIKSFTLQRKLDPATVGNILLKINAKLNGINHVLREQSYNTHQAGTMFLGGDVTHPSPDQRDIPSVVGVTASYDTTGFKYNASWRLQSPREEMIIDFENIVVDHMNFYKKKNECYPKKVLYYRDGVSEGQFQQVLDIEMAALKKAFKRLQADVKVSFIIVQKRHHTRFFPHPNFADGKNKNVPPGTVVDKDIVHPHQYQFYLASHAAIQGVTKPAKYCVIYDENGINADDMEAITYSLCHLFTRCNRSVSYPAPTYYAHLVAARGKQYIIGRRVQIDNLDREYSTRKISSEIVNNYPMFFV